MSRVPCLYGNWGSHCAFVCVFGETVLCLMCSLFKGLRRGFGLQRLEETLCFTSFIYITPNICHHISAEFALQNINELWGCYFWRICSDAWMLVDMNFTFFNWRNNKDNRLFHRRSTENFSSLHFNLVNFPISEIAFFCSKIYIMFVLFVTDDSFNHIVSKVKNQGLNKDFCL